MYLQIEAGSDTDHADDVEEGGVTDCLTTPTNYITCDKQTNTDQSHVSLQPVTAVNHLKPANQSTALHGGLTSQGRGAIRRWQTFTPSLGGASDPMGAGSRLEEYR